MEQFSNHPLYRRHNIDSAMSSLWEFYKKRFLSLFLISLFMSIVLQYASTMIDFKELKTITDPMILLEKMGAFIVPMIGLSIINLLFTTILQYYIIYNPLDRETNIFTSVIKSIKYYIPFLIIMVILAFAGSVAILLGLFVLIIGAFFAFLYIMTIYLFILPVMMVEGADIGNTIVRTIKLAHRNFWANIAWVAVIFIFFILASLILSTIILIPFTGGFLKTILNPGSAAGLTDVTNTPLFIILSAIASAITLPVMPIFACILYFNGKAEEELNQTLKQIKPSDEKVKVEDLYAKPYSDDHPENPEKNV